jgi:hypothetical protein
VGSGEVSEGPGEEHADGLADGADEEDSSRTDGIADEGYDCGS